MRKRTGGWGLHGREEKGGKPTQSVVCPDNAGRGDRKCLWEKERENSVASGRFVKLHNRPTPLVDKHCLLQPAERKQMQARCLHLRPCSGQCSLSPQRSENPRLLDPDLCTIVPFRSSHRWEPSPCPLKWRLFASRHREVTIQQWFHFFQVKWPRMEPGFCSSKCGHTVHTEMIPRHAENWNLSFLWLLDKLFINAL